MIIDDILINLLKIKW